MVVEDHQGGGYPDTCKQRKAAGAPGSGTHLPRRHLRGAAASGPSQTHLARSQSRGPSVPN